MPPKPKPRSWVTVLVSAAAGALIWALSPWLTGHQEPWDADGLFYVAALVVAGSVAGAITPRPLWGLYLGVLIGQFGYDLITQRIGPLFLIGAVFLLGYSVIFLQTGYVWVNSPRMESRPSERVSSQKPSHGVLV